MSTNFKYLLQHLFPVLHLNTLLREKHGVLSKEVTRSRLADPELYLALKISEIKAQHLKRTHYKLLLPGNGFLDKSVILIPTCSLTVLKEQTETLKLDSENLESEELASFMQTAPDALLCDESGKLPIICPFAIAQETKLENVLLYYYHQLGIYRLEHSDQTPAKNMITLDVLGRVREILKING